jgi:UPF0271 protein
MAVAQPALADAIARAVHDVDSRLVMFGLAGSCMLKAAERAGIAWASEAFADRNYLHDGSLVPRSRPDALVTDAEEGVRRVLRMVRESVVADVDGEDIPIRADTVCIHGDGPNAAQLARALRTGLTTAGVSVRAPHPYAPNP